MLFLKVHLSCFNLKKEKKIGLGLGNLFLRRQYPILDQMDKIRPRHATKAKFFLKLNRPRKIKKKHFPSMAPWLKIIFLVSAKKSILNFVIQLARQMHN